jgi:hypothetical protein
MKKLLTILGAILFATTVLTSCGDTTKTTEQCSDDVKAYEFGREMHTWTELRGGGSLSRAIDEYSREVFHTGYDANNECVIRGYSDSQQNKESPYNTEGKSWTLF